MADGSYLAVLQVFQEPFAGAVKIPNKLADRSLDLHMGMRPDDIIDDDQDIRGERVTFSNRVTASADNID